MKHPKKLQAMLDRLKFGDVAGRGGIFCEYQLFPHLDEYQKEDDDNFKRLYCVREGGLAELGQAVHELIKDKKITFLLFRERQLGNGYGEEEHSEYRHPNYTGIFVCDEIYSYAEEITRESHARLLFELAQGDYDGNTGEYLGYSGDYADFSDTV